MLHFAVIGLGRAGASRVECIRQHPYTKLYGTVSGRGGTHTLEQILSSPQVDAVIICTENARHYPLAKQALQHNKHVLVEFPLANYAHEVRDLIDTATGNNLALRCELIGLLTSAHLHRKAQTKAKQLQSLKCSFQGGYYRWVKQEALQGHHLQLAVGRIFAMWDLGGPLQITSCSISQRDDGYDLHAHFSGMTSTLHLHEHRSVNARRKTTWTGTFTDQTSLLTPPLGKREGLFYQDLDWFVKAITQRKPGYVTHDTLLAIGKLIDSM